MSTTITENSKVPQHLDVIFMPYLVL